MSTEVLPPEVGDGGASLPGDVPSGHFMTLYLVGTVTTGSIDIEVSWDRYDPTAWRLLVEDSVAKKLDSNNAVVRVRGPIVIRAVRRGPDAIGVSASNWNGNGII